MRFKYKNQYYDTFKSEGEESTNKFQVTDDNDLKKTFAKTYFGDDKFKKLIDHNELDVLFALALTSARYTDIIEYFSSYTYPGTYPDWVIKEFWNTVEELSKNNK